MIGVISSTIYPSDEPMYWGSPRTCIPPEERLEQTRKTVASLVEAGITELYLVDNSGERWRAGTEADLKPARVFVHHQHQFQNKGISEIYLLLGVLQHLPPHTPVLKISGRYYLNKNLEVEIGDADIAAKFHEYARSKFLMSTRCYMVKDKEVYKDFLRRTLRHLYGHSSRIVGPGSLLRVLRNSIFPGKDEHPYDDPVESIEIVSALVLARSRYKVKRVETLGIEGITGDVARRLIQE